VNRWGYFLWPAWEGLTVLSDGSHPAVASGSLRRSASESGSLRYRDGDLEGGNRCRRGLVLTILLREFLKKQGLKAAEM
jgi:hypothetical protein